MAILATVSTRHIARWLRVGGKKCAVFGEQLRYNIFNVLGEKSKIPEWLGEYVFFIIGEEREGLNYTSAEFYL